ncbi:hypothetical protein GCM10017673_48510 [Streptosporangium violaceochromogenes]|nr:hypothetical protein GCM10017673_48510 [Streptosporangium violaceochromogenes]
MSAKSFLTDRFVIGVDVKSYSSRSTRRQEDIQRALKEAISEAALAAGLDPAPWQRQPTGDGELLVLPADVDLVRVVARFAPELERLLRAYNSDRVESAQIRVRLAMHVDSLKTSAYWFAGPALVEVSRLLDARSLRKALENPDASVALIISEVLYRKTVLSDLGGLNPDQFTETTVDIPAKNFNQRAFLNVPGQFPKNISKADKPKELDSRPAPPIQNVIDRIDVKGNAQIGNIING